jgi:hypothetical protein
MLITTGVRLYLSINIGNIKLVIKIDDDTSSIFVLYPSYFKLLGCWLRDSAHRGRRKRRSNLLAQICRSP